MTRRCSHCSNNGHNSRTCSSRSGGGGCVKLFGVRLTDDSIIKKSASMGNLSAHYHSPSSSSSAAASPNSSTSPSLSPSPSSLNLLGGYLSDDPAQASLSPNRRSSSDRKKGIPWTEEEHRMFLLGLQKLGKGDWRGISRNFVVSRTPTQVASHAQKYFIRQTSATRRKRRSSLFDMVSDKATDQSPVKEEKFMLSPSKAVETDRVNSHQPSLDLTLKPDFGSMEATPYKTVEETKEITAPSSEINPPVIHSFFPASYLPLSLPLWPSNAPSSIGEERGTDTSCHRILKPIPVFPKECVDVDELVGMSKLNLGGNENGHIEPSPLSLRLLGEPSRQSAFHASTPQSMVQI